MKHSNILQQTSSSIVNTDTYKKEFEKGNKHSNYLTRFNAN